MLPTLLAIAPLAFNLAAPRPTHVSRTSTVQLSSWAALEGASRDGAVATLGELKESGKSALWNTCRIAPRPVTLRELTQTTNLDAKVLDPTASEFELEDIQNTFVKVIIGATVLSFTWALGTDALGVDAGLRFTGTYLIAGIPIGVLAIGSTAPGILFLPIEAFKAATANAEEKATRSERVCRHEASHLLTANVLGLPVDEVVAEATGPRVVVYDEESVQRPGVLVSAESINNLACVALSGLMAEADAFGKALGASEDLKLLNSMLARCSPPIPGQQQQDTTRYAALMAWTIIKKHPRAYDAITE